MDGEMKRGQDGGGRGVLFRRRAALKCHSGGKKPNKHMGDEDY